MGSSKTKGRMMTKDISNSKGFAALSPMAAVLFCMMIPHYSAYGKMNGDPGFIKGEICPRIPYITTGNIPKLLAEITKNTNVKWFECDGRMWIHSIKFLSEHQTLDPSRMGRDLLPSYSGVTPELVGPEVEVEVEEEGKPLSVATAPLSGGNGAGRPKKNRKVEYTPEFERFWAEYPRRLQKELAFKKFQRVIKEYSVEDVIKSAVGYGGKCAEDNKEERYIMHPTTFLNGGRWKDYCFED